MLPSTGLFKGFACPYFDNAGSENGNGPGEKGSAASSFTCKRPFCHFKHSRKGECVVPNRTGVVYAIYNFWYL